MSNKTTKTTEIRFQNCVIGTLLGTAVGDSLGLPFEGLSKKTVSQRIRSELKQCLLFGRGMISDDTELVSLTARALLAQPLTPEGFIRRFAWEYRFWTLSAPPGIGLASLRSGIKLCLGRSPSTSGVYSAGNAPALRSSIIGVILFDRPELREECVRLSTRTSHTDPKATIGSLALANLFADLVRDATTSDVPTRPSLERLQEIFSVPNEEDDEWKRVLSVFAQSARNGESVGEYAKRLGCENGVGGYIYRTVPIAVYSWFVNYDAPDKALREIVLCGGDADSTAAIVGALVGCRRYGEGDFLPEWSNRICDFPCSTTYLIKLGKTLAQPGASKPFFCRAFLPIRNAFFFVTIITHVAIRAFFSLKNALIRK